MRFGRRKFVNNRHPEIITVDADTPALVLPYPPTIDEKYLYTKTRRVPLYICGTLSFLSITAGMWLFSISTEEFYWRVSFVGLGFIVEFYMLIAYAVGYTGRDYDLENHNKVITEYATSPGDEPSVDILLPCCGEPLEILENTYKNIVRLSYTNFKVHVLDDGGLDTVKKLAESYGFNYIRRENRGYLKKAGNLRHSFNVTSGDFFVIFDADFCPRHDFLLEMVPIMRKETDIAIAQSPQFFRPCREQTWVEQGASSTQELFYRVIQVNRDRWGAPICVGSNAIYRREALKAVGGTAEIGHSEDVHTGFFAMTRGWRVKYVPLALARGVSPDTPKAYFSQQMRWCSGSSALLTNPEFWKSNLTIVQKLCFLTGMLYYSAAALGIFLNPMPGLLMLLFNPEHIIFYNFFFVIPAMIDSIFIFRLWSRQSYNFNCIFAFVIQQYAYLMAIKDKICGTTALWVPSGDNKAQTGLGKAKGGNNKYRNSRILCAVWVHFTMAATIGLSTFRILQGYHFYNYIPMLALDSYTVFATFRFIWTS
ncbi:nucleotide-diphospho-sugar transferase [Mycena maculata]|uniref:Nucleotide-diphospho-sugar transferase n=1 Tax=Mycena maculata TaxID=230809 RepID=A0AAD7MRF5_9AGAR|nr:nucleotide-diphospho-sugar transferase [Mycena maculata]